MSQSDETFPGDIAGEQLPNSKASPQFEFLIVAREGDTFAYSPAPEDASVIEDVMRTRSDLRNLVLDYDQSSEGLDTPRVDKFMERIGVRSPASVYLEGGNKESLLEVLAMFGADLTEADLQGTYVTNIDIAVIFRDRELDRLNGPEFAESVAVHERFHGAIEYSETIHVVSGEYETIESSHGFDERVLPSSVGEKPRTLGKFWREAAAEFMRGKYVEETRGQGGFTSRRDGAAVDVDGVPVPPKYLYAWKEDGEYNSMTLDPPALAAVGLEMLAERDPELIPALIRSCKDRVGLGEFESRVDAISSGLYKAIRDDYNGYFEEGRSFTEGTLHIMQALADTDRSEQ